MKQFYTYGLTLCLALSYLSSLNGQNVYTFTNAGATGRFGPSQAQLNSAYAGTTLAGQVTSNSGIQQWIVPTSGLHLIEARGAQGGGGGGLGAHITGEFMLTAGETLNILVGQAGLSTDGLHGSGGGGSFVTRAPHNTNQSILVIAGGGGGRGKTTGCNGCHGQAAQNPSNQAGNSGQNGGGGAAAAASPGGNGTTPGADVSGRTWTGGGGGFFSRGGNFNANTANSGGQSYISGGLGGLNPGGGGTNQPGGFGGGSSAGDRGAGGGGYSGGGGESNNGFNGGGGGSFNSGSNQINTTGVNSGHGLVTITQLYGVNIAENQPISCAGGQDGALTANVVGGVSPFSYSWSNSGTGQSITGLPAGNYSVTVTDAGNTQTTNSFTLSDPTPLTVSATPSNPTCAGGADGSINVSVSGGTSPYSYTWSNAATSQNISGLAAGNYALTVTDANSCDTTLSFVLNEPNPDTLVVTKDDALCLGDSSGSAQVIVNVEYNFTTTGKSGAFGPTQAEINTAYSGTSLDGEVISNNGIQEWSVPFTGEYRIEAAGAEGNGTSGGAGAIMAGDFTLNQGQVLKILVGQRGTGSDNAGGGSFITDISNNPLVIAGGGGSGTAGTWNEAGGRTSTSGGNGSLSGSSINNAGTGGNGGGPPNSGPPSAGGGFFTDGDADGGKAFLNGGEGSTNGGQGGFGGGGARRGGGGGYSGGGAGGWGGGVRVGGGGGSINNGINQTNSAAANSDEGYVKITLLSPPIVSYLWNTGDTTQTINNKPAGTYTVTATNPLGCSLFGEVTIDEPTLLTTNISKTDVTCNGGSDGVATASASGGTPPNSFNWNTGGNAATVSGLSQGLYHVTVTDDNGCITVDSIVIDEPAPTTANINVVQNETCNGASDGSLSVAGSFSSYSWSNGQSTQTITGLPAGTYSVTVTDANGCSAIGSEQIILEDTIPPSITTNNSTLSLSATGLLTISPGDIATITDNCTVTNISVSQNNFSCSDTGTVIVTVTATDNNSNTTSEQISFNIIDDTPPTIQVQNATVLLDAQGQGSISLADIDNGSSDNCGIASSTLSQTNFTCVNIGINTVTLTVTDVSGNVTAASAQVTVVDTIDRSLTLQINEVSCFGGNDGFVTVSDTAGIAPYTYNWSSGGSGNSAQGLTSGTYFVTAINSNGCETQKSFTISEPSQLQSVVLTSTGVSCNGGNDGTATAVAQGGTAPYTFTWSGSAGTGSMVTGLSQGTYTVTATDDNGCTSTSTVIIDEPTQLTAVISDTTNVSCFGANDGTATVSASGGTPGYSYVWSNNQGDPTAIGLGSGSFGVTVTDANGCNVNVSATITEPAALDASLNTMHVSCNGGSDGTLEAVVSGGTSPYSYNWSNGDTATTTDSLTSGLYLVTISDANGCNTVLSNFVNEPSALTASVNISSEITCNGEADGGAIVNAQGGTAPYSYAWSNGDTLSEASAVDTGLLSITVTDNNGCQTSNSVVFTQPDSISILIDNIRNVSCFGYRDGGADAVATGGTFPYAFTWSSGENFAKAERLSGGINELQVLDANGCLATAAVNVGQPEQIDTSLIIEHQGALIANAEGEEYSYIWWDCELNEPVPGATGRYFEPAGNGTFALIINDGQCSDTSQCFNLDRVNVFDRTKDAIGLNIYPNPNMGQFNVRLTGSTEENVEMTVMDMSGKQVLLKKLGRLSGELVEELNIDIAAGVYFVRIKTNEDLIIRRVAIQ